MIKAIVFDFGGTLDTGGNHWGKVMWRAWQQHGIDVAEDQFREAYVFAERTLDRNPIVLPTYTFKKLFDLKIRLQLEYVFAHGWWKADKQVYSQVVLAMLTDLYEAVSRRLYDNKPVLQRLKENYRLALVTNFYGNMSTVLQEFHYDHLFEHVIESAVVGLRKPDTNMLQMALHTLEVRPDELVVVGDSLRNDIEPARYIGCHTVWLKGEGWTPLCDEEIVPDQTISHLTEICIEDTKKPRVFRNNLGHSF